MKNTNKQLHIISFDNPYPPSYGGAIDVFYRLKSLSESGIAITLHCFYKDRERRDEELESLCKKVYYYPRKQTVWQHCTLLPFVVASRTNDSLLERLLEDDAPILFEGLMSCALMNHPALCNRKKYFRECNVEHDYYHALARATNVWWKKLFYHLEACRLKRFERCLNSADEIWALAHQDEAYFKAHYPNARTRYIPCSHAHTSVVSKIGMGQPYILYHGNLAVEENEKAALYIIEQIAPNVALQVIIAGSQPSIALQKAIRNLQNAKLIANPSSEEMDQLIADAQLHLLITFQATGIKLKLLNVLYCGRHVVVNPQMIEGTDFAELCHIGNDKEELVSLCNKLSTIPFTQDDVNSRQMILNNEYKHLDLII